MKTAIFAVVGVASFIFVNDMLYEGKVLIKKYDLENDDQNKTIHINRFGLTGEKSESHFDVDEHKERHKRGILALAGALASVVGLLFGAGSFTYGVSNGQQRLSELRQIQSDLRALDGKIDDLMDQTELSTVGIIAGQQMLQGAVLYGNDLQRLQWFLHVMANDLSISDDGSLQPRHLAVQWADAVLSFNYDGEYQVLYNLNDMIMGTGHFFGSKPLVEVFKQTLSSGASDFWEKIHLFKEFIYSVQVAGYAAWVSALNVKGRTNETRAVRNKGNDTIEGQIELMERVATPWPKGSYGLPSVYCGSSRSCPSPHGITWRFGSRYHDTEDDRNQDQVSEDSKVGIGQCFCIKSDATTGYGEWPKGTYCVFKKGNCPSGFNSGSIYWDDEDNSNGNSHAGVLPDGQYGTNTKIYYCCRNDASAYSEIYLNTEEEFHLIRYGQQCQRVKYTRVTTHWVYWDTENYSNDDRTSGAHPEQGSGSSSHRIFYCYYEPI